MACSLSCCYKGKNQHFLAMGDDSIIQWGVDLIIQNLHETEPGLNLSKPDLLARPLPNLQLRSGSGAY